MSKYENMSLEELQRIAGERFEAAENDGTLDKIRNIAITLGQPDRPSQMVYTMGSIRVSTGVETQEDKSISVLVDGKMVCSNRSCMVFVRGPWLGELFREAEAGMAVRARAREERKARERETERRMLVDALGEDDKY